MTGKWRLALLLLAVAVAFACRETLLEPERAETGDGVAESPGQADQSAEPEPPPAPGTLGGALGGGTSATGAGPIDIGSYEERTLVEITVSGLLDVYDYYPPEVRGRYAGQLDAAGDWVFWLNGCKGRTNVSFDGGGGFGVCDHGDQLPPQEVWTQRSAVLGNGQMERRPGPTKGNLRCDDPGFPPCYTLSGSMTATVTPTADELQLEADRASVAPGEQVTFTASTTNEEPFEVREWLWIANFAGAENAPDPGTVPCTNEVDECVTGVMETGTMYVRALVANVIQQAEAPVSVQPDDLLLGADPTEVWPGETVTFTTSTAKDFPYDISRWTWQAAVADPEGPPGTQPCAAHEKVCETGVHESGTMTVEGWVAGNFRTAAASVDVLSCGEEDITVTKAAGPNPDGSFLAGERDDLGAENVIEVEAGLESDCVQLEVQWEVEDLPDEWDVPSPPVGTPAPGAQSAFVVPLPQGRSWPGAPPHEPNVELTALAYRVRAYVEPPSGRINSAWARVGQDAIDVIRQEYMEVRPTRTGVSARIPARNEFHGLPNFSSSYGPWPIYGDHCPFGSPPCRSLSQPRLVALVGWLENRWFYDRLQINSVYRNPVHHHRHLNLPANDSPHKYGTAVDFQTFGLESCRYVDWSSPPVCESARNIYWAVLRNLGLTYPGGDVCAEPYRLSGIGHVHFDLRDAVQPACLADWRERTAPPDTTPPDTTTEKAADATQLLAGLRASDWRERADAVFGLYSLPLGRLPAGWQRAVIDLLGREAAAAGSLSGLSAADEHAYGEYLIELVILARNTDDPAAVRPLAVLGIDVSRDVRRFVARHPGVGLTALDEVYRDRPPLRADVIATLGEMLEGNRLGMLTLTAPQRVSIDRRLLRAAQDPTPAARWALASVAGESGLAEWTPALEQLAATAPDESDPLDLVGRTARTYLPDLRAANAALPASERLRRLQRLQAAVCTDASGSRGVRCAALDARLARLGDALARRAPAGVRAAVDDYRAALRDRAAAAFSELERRLLTENAAPLAR